jgi:hypothetical protein
VLSVAKAETNISWLPEPVIVSRVARHLGCGLEFAQSRIIQEAEAGRIKACGLTVEGWPMSPLPIAWRVGVGWDVDVDLCLDDVIAADLLPTSAERLPAQVALAYIIEGMLLEGIEWTTEMVQQTERAEIVLGEAIGAGRVPAWGKRAPYGPMEQIPPSDFRVDMVERKGAPPRSAAHLPKVVVRVDEIVGISPAHRFADYRGPHWSSIECGSASLRPAFSKPLRVERHILHEAEQLYSKGAKPAARAADVAGDQPRNQGSTPRRHFSEQSAKTFTANYIKTEQNKDCSPTMDGLEQAARADGYIGGRQLLRLAWRQYWQAAGHEVSQGRGPPRSAE